MNMDRFTNITFIDIDNCTDKEQKPQSTVFDQDLKWVFWRFSIENLIKMGKCILIKTSIVEFIQQ